jgi:hypothetical protein
MAIIALSGYAKSGKNTVAGIIQYLLTKSPIHLIESTLKDYGMTQLLLEGESGWEQKGFADKLKETASLLTGIPVKQFHDQDFKLTNLPPQWNNHGMPMTVREFLQKLGTDALRDGLHPNTWVNALMSEYKPELNWIITDCRFINEANAVKKENGIIVRINRPGIVPVNNHSSETGLDGYEFDHVIENYGNFNDLVLKVEALLTKYMIL